jgi:hydrogenase expression/formation protein HypD
MKHIAQEIIRALSQFSADVNLMEVCGTHTMAIARSGIRGMLPKNVKLLSGPGCPVCVTPQETIDYVIALGQRDDVVIATFGDMVRVPGTESTLEQVAPQIVYSPLDALAVAQESPDKNVVFVGVGFETTSPTVAATVIRAHTLGISNFFVVPAFKLIPPALDFIARSPQINVHGFLLPGHVSTIIGSEPYQFLAQQYNLPGCVTGFEPIDILQGILSLVRHIAQKTPSIDIEYRKVVRPEGNRKALEILYNVFRVTDARWRGIGGIQRSGLAFKTEFEQFDATKKFSAKIPRPVEPRGCICGKVLLGLNSPIDCKLFGTRCTPLTPVGPCMVSSEGSCAAYYKYGAPSRAQE